MKLSLTFTYHYIIFLGMAILFTPAKLVCSHKEKNEIRIEKKQQISAAVENTAGLISSDMFFKY